MAQNHDPAQLLTKAFNTILKKEFGSYIPPKAFITPFGIRPFDTLLGNGLTSSAPIAFSSTPETGKSTLALQFVASFLRHYPKAMAMFIDTESCSDDGETLPHEIQQRAETFGIDTNRFVYKAIVADVKEIFDMLHRLCEMKRELQSKLNEEVKVLLVLDSIASPVSSRDESSEDPNSTIGFKARELTFNLGKFRREVAMDRITFILIDQVRSNMQIQTRFQPAQEKSVGTWNNFKSATNVSALQHNLRQWVFFSRNQQLKPDDTLGVDGWIMNAYTEKNKLVPSQCCVPLIFDKKYGAVPILSEYYFLQNLTKTEKKFWEKETKLNYPLCVKSSGKGKVLQVTNPETGQPYYTSEKFMERKLLDYYNKDENFRYWFNYAVDMSCYQRITLGLFRDMSHVLKIDSNENDAIENESTPAPASEPVPEPVSAPLQQEQTIDDNTQISNNYQNEEQYNVFYNMHTGQKAFQNMDGTLFDAITGETIDSSFFNQYSSEPPVSVGTKELDTSDQV